MTIPSDGAVNAAREICGSFNDAMSSIGIVCGQSGKDEIHNVARMIDHEMTPAIQERDEAIRELASVLKDLDSFHVFLDTVVPPEFGSGVRDTMGRGRAVREKYAHFINDIPKEKAG